MEGRGGAIKIDYFIKLSSGFGVVDSPKERGRSLVSQTRSSDIMAALPRSSSQICSYYVAGEAVSWQQERDLFDEREGDKGKGGMDGGKGRDGRTDSGMLPKDQTGKAVG